MENYIDILLASFEEQWVDFLSRDYYLERARLENAEEALWQTLSESQIELFLSYEGHRNAVAFHRETCTTRQAFLLAKELYR